MEKFNQEKHGTVIDDFLKDLSIFIVWRIQND